jgi:hypothetical protein
MKGKARFTGLLRYFLHSARRKFIMELGSGLVSCGRYFSAAYSQ